MAVNALYTVHMHIHCLNQSEFIGAYVMIYLCDVYIIFVRHHLMVQEHMGLVALKSSSAVWCVMHCTHGAVCVYVCVCGCTCCVAGTPCVRCSGALGTRVSGWTKTFPLTTTKELY